MELCRKLEIISERPVSSLYNYDMIERTFESSVELFKTIFGRFVTVQHWKLEKSNPFLEIKRTIMATKIFRI